MKIIRWPGFVGFIVIVGGLIGGTLLFAETLVKSFIESTWTDMNQAKVDVSSVNISYSPFAVTVNNIQVTDPTQPMINSAQIGNAHFALSFGDLLLKKVIIDDMSVNDIRVSTPRKYSGAIRKPKKEAKQDSGESMFSSVMPDIDLPDINQVMQNESITAEKKVDQLKQDLDATQQQWSKMRDDIVDQKRWDALRARYDKIRQDFRGDTAKKLEAIQEAKQLRKDIAAELERIRNARRTINNDGDRIEAEYKAAKAAPKEDIQRIKDKYKLDNLNAGNVTELLFGAKTAEYLQLAQTWYARIKPYIKSENEAPKVKRSEGQYIAFREFNPRPAFYVRNASLDANLPRGEFVGSVTDISSDQTISKKPTRFNLTGKKMKHRDSEQLDGEFNYVDPTQGFTRVSYLIKNYQLEEVTLSKSDKLALSMKRSLMTLDIEARLQSGQLDGRGDARFNRVQFATGTSSSGSLTRMLSASFANIHDFDVNARFKGKLRDLDIDMKSNLDNQVGREFKAQIEQRKQQFERDLRARIDAKLAEPMAKIDATRKRMDDVKTQLDNYEKEFDQKLADLDQKIDEEKELKKQKLDNKIDKKKDALKNKLLDKFR